jgi:hypothetical protein
MENQKKSKWTGLLEHRQMQEIEFARVYATKFNHGTSGHMAYMIIAKLAGMLDDAEDDATANGGSLAWAGDGTEMRHDDA